MILASLRYEFLLCMITIYYGFDRQESITVTITDNVEQAIWREAEKIFQDPAGI